MLKIPDKKGRVCGGRPHDGLRRHLTPDGGQQRPHQASKEISGIDRSTGRGERSRIVPLDIVPVPEEMHGVC